MIKSFTIRVGCVAAALLVPAAATANETVTYTYDARGRLIEVDRAGTVNDGVSTIYTLDKADNRTNKTTTGATPPSPLLSIGNESTLKGESQLHRHSLQIHGPVTLQDSSAEGSEIFGAGLMSANGGATISDNLDNGTITNDD